MGQESILKTNCLDDFTAGASTASRQKPLVFFTGSDKILRDFTYIDDVIQANLKAVSAKKSGVYNVGTGTLVAFKILLIFYKKSWVQNTPQSILKNPYAGSYQMHTQADISSSTQNLGYEPQMTLEKGIKSVY